MKTNSIRVEALHGWPIRPIRVTKMFSNNSYEEDIVYPMKTEFFMFGPEWI
jgi:hypothetical protein